MRTIICLMGPTAAGKTAVASYLYTKLPIEIISVDSSMIYKGMNIGTAKPLNTVPHYLINICDPKEVYSVAEFCKDAAKIIEAIFKREKIPLLVGGTMLYFHALQQGLAKLPTRKEDIRLEINKLANEYGWSYLHDELKKWDEEAALKIHPHDKQRIQRALEVYLFANEKISNLKKINFPFLKNTNFLNIGLIPSNRAFLHEQIKNRFLKMLEDGFIKEVEQFFHRGDLNLTLPSMRCLGYKQIWQYLSGEFSYDVMIEKSLAATRQYAKRQLTWLRRWPHLSVFDCEKTTLNEDVLAQINAWLH